MQEVAKDPVIASKVSDHDTSIRDCKYGIYWKGWRQNQYWSKRTQRPMLHLLKTIMMIITTCAKIFRELMNKTSKAYRKKNIILAVSHGGGSVWQSYPGLLLQELSHLLYLIKPQILLCCRKSWRRMLSILFVNLRSGTLTAGQWSNAHVECHLWMTQRKRKKSEGLMWPAQIPIRWNLIEVQWHDLEKAVKVSLWCGWIKTIPQRHKHWMWPAGMSHCLAITWLLVGFLFPLPPDPDVRTVGL